MDLLVDVVIDIAAEEHKQRAVPGIPKLPENRQKRVLHIGRGAADRLRRLSTRRNLRNRLQLWDRSLARGHQAAPVVSGLGAWTQEPTLMGDSGASRPPLTTSPSQWPGWRRDPGSRGNTSLRLRLRDLW